MKQQHNKALGFIFITLMIDVTGLGLIIPVMPELIQSLAGGSIGDASRIGGWLTFTYAIMQFFFAPILGGLSDQYGRRPVLLAALFGFAVDYIFLTLAPTIGWLFVGRAIAGITGASFTTATAYIADVSDHENRAKNFGLIGAAFGLGFIIGPVIGGLLGSFGPRVPFIVAAALSFANWVYGYTLLPESLKKENRRPFNWKRANPIGSLRQAGKYKGIRGLMVSFMLIYVASHAVQSNWSFFSMERLGWNETMIGISLGVVGILVALVQGVLIRWVNPKLGNERSVYVGLMLYTIGMFLFTFANTTWMMFVFLVPYCLGGLGVPALQSIMSGSVPANEQGELQGALTSLISITSIIGPPLMTGLFSHFTNPATKIYFPGAAFFLGGLLNLASVIVAYRILHPRFHPRP